jgi:hypothetical protein
LLSSNFLEEMGQRDGTDWGLQASHETGHEGSLRKATVMPKEAVRVSEDGLTTSALARRARQ